MLRRLACTNARNGAIKALAPASTTTALTTAQRNLEPMSVFYLASWCCMWWYAFYFWFPMLWTDIFAPTYVYNKLPVIHFISEKKAEQKLRRVLDETYTSWTVELDQSAVTDAIARTF